MSDQKAVFQGSYCDLKFIKSRSCAQIILEIPVERAAEFVAAFGAPLPGKEVPVALARLDPSRPASEPRKGNGEAVKERRPFGALPLSQQAAMRCQDAEFRNFLSQRDRCVYPNAETAAERVRAICKVQSRSEIRERDDAGHRWLDLDGEYVDWKHAVPLAEPTR